MSLCSVFRKNGQFMRTIHVPSVIRHSPIRPDVVQFVNTQLSKNHRQPYGRSPYAGHQHSAESWGTGRAVARVPRISGSGTSRNGQGAFANMTRGGRMFSPLKIWRRWHRLVNVTQKRYAMCSAIAASAVPSLVMAHGHRIEKVQEIPLVVSNEAEKIKKTKEAVALLNALKASSDVKRSADSRKMRAGQGKMRNRRYVQRKGVLIVHARKQGLTRAMRNISGVNCINVNRLNLREMAPGGHLGRFVIWTEAAFKKLDALYGTRKRNAQLKKGYRHPASHMTLTDLSRIIHSKTVRKVLRNRRRKQPKIPRVRGELLLVRKIRRNTIKNSAVRQARKARLEKLRTAGKLPALPAKKAKSKRPAVTDPWGLPLRRKERRVILRKMKEERKAAKAGAKKKKMARVQKAIADSKARTAAIKKKLAETKRPPRVKPVKPTSKAEKKKKQLEAKKAKLATLAKKRTEKKLTAHKNLQKQIAQKQKKVNKSKKDEKAKKDGKETEKKGAKKADDKKADKKTDKKTDKKADKKTAAPAKKTAVPKKVADKAKKPADKKAPAAAKKPAEKKGATPAKKDDKTKKTATPAKKDDKTKKTAAPAKKDDKTKKTAAPAKKADDKAKKPADKKAPAAKKPVEKKPAAAAPAAKKADKKPAEKKAAAPKKN